MKSKTINFFATKSDIEIILRLVEEERKIKYTECGLFTEKIKPTFSSFIEIPKLGISIKGDFILEPCYLIVGDETQIIKRQVPQKSGGVRYAIDQAKNQESIVFRYGGIYQDHKTLIAGQIGTVSKNPVSIDLFNLFSRFIKKLFIRIDGYYIGNEAKKLLENGARLTSNFNSPILYDLKNTS